MSWRSDGVIVPENPNIAATGLLSWVVGAFRVALELRTIEVDVPQIAGTVALSFVIEMRLSWIAAFAAGSNGFGEYVVPKLDRGDKTVAARPIPLFCAEVRMRVERGQRAPT